MINRSLITIKIKEPFRQWLLSLPDPDDTTLDELNADSTAYLIPEYDDENQRDRILKKVFSDIFEEQLGGWWTDEKDWPIKRDFKTFKQWFDVEFHSVIEDFVEGEIIDED